MMHPCSGLGNSGRNMQLFPFEPILRDGASRANRSARSPQQGSRGQVGDGPAFVLPFVRFTDLWCAQ
eukprot:11280826-Alexandrium_andersonii.AAC.1